MLLELLSSRGEFILPFWMFQRAVLLHIRELALKVGCKSPRAVGNALHKNPFAPLVPCHRVVWANGEIGGYAFGEQEKLRLLREEARDCFGE